MATTTHLSISLVEQAQAQKEITINQAFTRIDAILNTGAKSRSLATPPSSPVAGDVYIVAAAATADWAGQAGKIAYFDAIWRFITPREGVALWVNDEDITATYNGANWLLDGVITQSGSSYTLASSDHKSRLRFSSSSAINLTLPNNLPTGFCVQIIQAGAGQITFSASSGGSLHNRQSFTKTAGQYAVCNLQIISNSSGTNAEYLLSGDGAV
jgi:hypothetical protein